MGYRLHATILEELERHGLEPGPDDGPVELRERLNDLYVEAIRALKARLKDGEFPMSDYPRRVDELRRDYPLLGIPVDRWKA